MTDTEILDTDGAMRIQVSRRPMIRDGFSVGMERFSDALPGLRAQGDQAQMLQRSRAMLNHALLSQRPIHGGKALPVGQDPEDIHLLEALMAEPRMHFGMTEISLDLKSGDWTQADIFRRQPHAAWMYLVDAKIGARRGLAAAALRDYWRLVCLEMPDLEPGKNNAMTVHMPRGPGAAPVLVSEDVIFHAQHVTVLDMIRMTLKHGGRGFVSVGPGQASGKGRISLSLVALTAPHKEVLSSCLQPAPLAEPI